MYSLNNDAIKVIPFNQIKGVKMGHAQDDTAITGCTVLMFDDISDAGVDVRGGGPASRETTLLDPVSNAKGINALVLSGGSAFGLDCAAGVMQYMEERKIGYNVGYTVVPLVCASCIFDLNIGDTFVRPDKAMGYKACEDTINNRGESGCFGAGCGATVGKYTGPENAMKSGLGTYAIQIGDLQIGAVVALNALGDIFDITDGKQIAGALKPDKSGFSGTMNAALKNALVPHNVFDGNTTIGAIVTNAAFDKSKLKKIAAMTHNGYARCINPVHTTADGDSIYAISVGNVTADLDVVGSLAAEVMSMAIREAILKANSADGYVSAKDLTF